VSRFFFLSVRKGTLVFSDGVEFDLFRALRLRPIFVRETTIVGVDLDDAPLLENELTMAWQMSRRNDDNAGDDNKLRSVQVFDVLTSDNDDALMNDDDDNDSNNNNDYQPSIAIHTVHLCSTHVTRRNYSLTISGARFDLVVFAHQPTSARLHATLQPQHVANLLSTLLDSTATTREHIIALWSSLVAQLFAPDVPSLLTLIDRDERLASVVGSDAALSSLCSALLQRRRVSLADVALRRSRLPTTTTELARVDVSLRGAGSLLLHSHSSSSQQQQQYLQDLAPHLSDAIEQQRKASSSTAVAIAHRGPMTRDVFRRRVALQVCVISILMQHL
jgi:hypothetical protein